MNQACKRWQISTGPIGYWTWKLIILKGFITTNQPEISFPKLEWKMSTGFVFAVSAKLKSKMVMVPPTGAWSELNPADAHSVIPRLHTSTS